MEHFTVFELIEELGRRGIRVTNADTSECPNVAWERRKHAVCAWQGIRDYHRRIWELRH